MLNRYILENISPLFAITFVQNKNYDVIIYLIIVIIKLKTNLVSGQQNNYNTQSIMSSYAIVPSQDIVGLVYSIVGLALVVPIMFGFRHYWRLLDYLQFCYIFAIIFGLPLTFFSSQVDETWLIFMPNFLVFCTQGDFVCRYGGLLSFTLCLIAVLLILLIVVLIEKQRRPDLRFEPIYTFFKGFFRWTYFPLTYYSMKTLAVDLYNGGQSFQIISSAVVLGICTFFPIGQLILYIVFKHQSDYIWTKWLEFANYLRFILVTLLLVLYQLFGSAIPIYFIYGPFLIYIGLYLLLQKFLFKIFGRVVFAFGQVIIITLFSLFIFAPQYIRDYDLDLFGISAVILIQLLYYIARIYHQVRYGKQQDKISPQFVEENTFQSQKKNSFKDVDVEGYEQLNKKNLNNNKSYEHLEYQNSKETLNNSYINKKPPNRRR